MSAIWHGSAARSSTTLAGVPGVKLVTDAVKAGLHAGAIAPVEAGATALSNIPLGWVPGGANDTFKQMGDWMRTNDPAAYQEWQTTQAAADANVLGGGNMKADFNREWLSRYADQTYQGESGLGAISPEFAIGGAALGLLGGALAHAIQGFWGIGSAGVQRLIGGSGLADPSLGQTSDGVKVEGKSTALNRVQESMYRLDHGQEVSDVERFAVEQVKSGAWSEDHAANWIVSHGQGYTRNAAGQLFLTASTDPLIYATLGAGAVSAAGSAGLKLAESGLEAESMMQKASLAVRAIQENPLMGPASKITRGLIDPFGVMPKRTATQGIVDLTAGASNAAFERTYGPETIQQLYRDASEFGFADQLASDIGGYSADQARLYMAVQTQVTQMAKDFGESLVHMNPDDVIEPMLRGASNDAVTKLTDFMYRNAKNTFTAGERDFLARRIAVSYGGTVDEWAGRIAKMSHDTASAYHAVTYKTADQALNEAMAKVTGYTGDLPLDRLVLVNDANLSDIAAQSLLDEIKNTKGLAAKAKVWNDASLLYSKVADLGRAAGSKAVLGRLTGAVEQMLKDGKLVRIAEPTELADGALAPVRDMLDRFTVDGEPLWNIGFRPSEDVAWGMIRHPVTGKWMVERAPTISHVVDAVPAAKPFSNTTRNLLGQVIGIDKARALNRPIESIEAFGKTMADQVTGRRLVLNIQRRFEKSVVEELGLPASTARRLFAAARDAAGIEHTTIRGLGGQNVFQQDDGIDPRGSARRHRRAHPARQAAGGFGGRPSHHGAHLGSVSEDAEHHPSGWGGSGQLDGPDDRDDVQQVALQPANIPDPASHRRTVLPGPARLASGRA